MRVDLPARGISGAFEVEVTDNLYVGVSRVGESLVPIIRAEPFTGSNPGMPEVSNLSGRDARAP